MICDTCTKQPGCRTLPAVVSGTELCGYYSPTEREINRRILDLKSDIEKHKECVDQTLKDSGDRTEFPTGAVRDMHTGKGRMDLLPWSAIVELSKHCEKGALKYGERNIDKGVPMHSLLDSAFRHLAMYMEGKKDEPHLVSALWNIAWAVQFEKEMPDIQDIPSRNKKSPA